MSATRPSRYTPGSSVDGSNQARRTSRAVSIHSVEAPVKHSSRRQTLEDAAMQDVGDEVKLFDEYVSTRAPSARGRSNRSIRSLRAAPLSTIIETSLTPLSAIVETSGRGTELGRGTESHAQASSDQLMSEPQTFLETVELKREAAGITSFKYALGSRRVSYAPVLEVEDSGEAQPLVRKRSDSVAVMPHKEAPTSTPELKSAFMSWIQFCGLSKPFLGFLMFLYLFFPAPRLWFDQWTGFWAANSYSSDSEFNICAIA